MFDGVSYSSRYVVFFSICECDFSFKSCIKFDELTIMVQSTGTPPNAIAAGVANIGTKDVVSNFFFHFRIYIEFLFNTLILF